MRKLIWAAFALVLLATNPSKESYIDHVKSDIGIKSGLVSFFADPLIDKTTTEHNLYLGTIYTTYYGDRKVTTLGVLNKFIPLK